MMLGGKYCDRTHLLGRADLVGPIFCLVDPMTPGSLFWWKRLAKSLSGSTNTDRILAE